ncbi:MAG: GT4 family glycosyltransferase PelF [Bryobacterales bacterium]|nr:GT4 family glycosyltransferase PelF [Bryobacterales bacterium]
MPYRARILLTTEGTYPHYPGGVSVWCDQLIQAMPAYGYHVYSITHSPSQPARFRLPANVIGSTTLPLWGTEEPGWSSGDFMARFQRRVATTSGAVRDHFTSPFRRAVTELLRGSRANEQALGGALFELYRLFHKFDYASALETEIAWRTFLHAVETEIPAGDQPNLEEATSWMRWLTRYLAVVSTPLPQVDLVQASFAGLAGVPGVLAKLSQGSKFLLTEHGIFLRELYLALSRSESSQRDRCFLRNFNHAIVKMNYFYADQITSLGSFNKVWQLRFGAPAHKIVYLANGVNPGAFKPAPELRPERPTVVTMARISPIKGIDTLARAAATVRDAVPDVLFRVCGDVADTGYFARVQAIIKERKLEENFQFGIAENVVKAYQQAHVFCLPSNTEGMPYSILEAMLCACPVVATDVGNVAETIAETGLVVRPNDPPKLADALLQLLAGPHAEERRAQLAAAGLARAKTKYTIDMMAERSRQLYEGLLTRNEERETTRCKTKLQYA